MHAAASPLGDGTFLFVPKGRPKLARLLTAGLQRRFIKGHESQRDG
jgi:hypothetical protein